MKRIKIIFDGILEPYWFKERFLQENENEYKNSKNFNRLWLGEWKPEGYNEGGTVKHISALFKGGRVKRYHTEALIGQQTVSEHSWGLAVIIDKLWPKASKNVIMAALYHDAHEGELGDIPAPTKRVIRADTAVLDTLELEFDTKHGILFESLSPTERAMLKVADYLELVLFCQHQYKMGNGHLRQVEYNGIRYVKNILDNNPSLLSEVGPNDLNYIWNVLGVAFEKTIGHQG